MKSFTPFSSLPLLLLLAGATLRGQELQRTLQYQFPVPNAQMVSRETTITIRPGDILDRNSINTLSLFNVTGSSSGFHTGKVVLSDDRRTAIFKPDVLFSSGEAVTVAINRGLRTNQGITIAPQRFTFVISATSDEVRMHPGIQSLDIPTALQQSSTASLSDVKENKGMRILSDTLPDDFPSLKIMAFNQPTSGDVYISNFVFDRSIYTVPYLMVLDNSTTPIYYKKMRGQCFDFKKQPNGTMTYYDQVGGRFYQMDSSYVVIDSFKCGHGYATDLHDLLLLPNGHVLMIGMDPQTVDMSQLVAGGNSNATVVGAVIQELDGSKNVVFEWRSFDHFQITDATYENLLSSSIDYVHANAIELDNDGNILLSSRHMDEITKIDRSNGNIIWRLGGKHNQFTFVNDSIGFSHQHAIRRLANGHITLFDNGNYHAPAFSRAVEYQLDEQNKTATLVWQYRHTPDIYSYAMGYVQRLPNGNTLIGWGANPTVTEVDSIGAVRYEIQLPPGVFSYRAYRFSGPTSNVVKLISPWSGSEGTTLIPMMQWHPLTGTSAYHLQVAADPAFRYRVIDDSTITTTSYQLDTLYGGRLFYWRVRPLPDSSFGDWSEPWSFRTALATVKLMLPANDSAKLSLTPVFYWNSSPGANLYRLQVALDDSFQSPVFDDSTITTTWQQIPLSSYSTHYYWRVQALSDVATSAWSETWSLTTLDPPTVEELITPPDGSEAVPLDPLLQWSEFPGATHYRLQVSRWDPSFINPEIDDSLVTETSYQLPKLDGSTTYYWRVQPIVDATVGTWSLAWYFQTAVDTSLHVIPILPPDKAVVGKDSIRFVWDRFSPGSISVAGSMQYRLEIASDSAFARTFIDSTLADTMAVISSTYFSEKEYWWRVGVIDSSGEGHFSSERSFQTTPPTSEAAEQNAAAGISLEQNVPNPFSGSTAIRFTLPTRQLVRLQLLGVDGTQARTLLDATLDRGEHTFILNTRGLASGVYIYLLATPDATLMRRMIVLH